MCLSSVHEDTHGSPYALYISVLIKSLMHLMQLLRSPSFQLRRICNREAQVVHRLLRGWFRLNQHLGRSRLGEQDHRRTSIEVIYDIYGHLRERAHQWWLHFSPCLYIVTICNVLHSCRWRAEEAVRLSALLSSQQPVPPPHLRCINLQVRSPATMAGNARKANVNWPFQVKCWATIVHNLVIHGYTVCNWKPKIDKNIRLAYALHTAEQGKKWIMQIINIISSQWHGQSNLQSNCVICNRVRSPEDRIFM